MLIKNKIDIPKKLVHLKFTMSQSILIKKTVKHFMESNKHLEKVTFKLEPYTYDLPELQDHFIVLLDLIITSNLPLIKLKIILAEWESLNFAKIKEKYGTDLYIFSARVENKIILIFLH